jgi:hypothetical protein
LRLSAYQRLIYNGVFTSFQRHGPVSVEMLNKAKEVIFDIKLLKVTRPNNNHVVKKNQMVASGQNLNPFYKMHCLSFKMTILERILCLLS